MQLFFEGDYRILRERKSFHLILTGGHAIGTYPSLEAARLGAVQHAADREALAARQRLRDFARKRLNEKRAAT